MMKRCKAWGLLAGVLCHGDRDVGARNMDYAAIAGCREGQRGEAGPGRVRALSEAEFSFSVYP